MEKHFTVRIMKRKTEIPGNPFACAVTYVNSNIIERKSNGSG